MVKIDFAEQAVTTTKELRKIIGTPHEHIEHKAISIMDEHCKKFISMSPLMFLSTSDSKGNGDVSPRGDEPGFVHVINKTQLVIPERPGNKRGDSLINLLSNPKVGLVFLIPGLEYVLRVNGSATIIKNPDILSHMKWNNTEPLLGIGVDVEECYIHCPRALKVSNVWDTNKWQSIESVPKMMEVFRAHLKMNGIDL